MVFVHPDGTRTAGSIAVAAPVELDDQCVCEVALDGLERRYTIFGHSKLQALLLGTQFLGTRLHDLLSRGMRVELASSVGNYAAHAGRELAEPMSVLFGPLLRAGGRK
ncbi:hypothetical protein BH11MYX3_BH11MYX3_43290 [soil metagenome]